ncbi:carnosine N-methyltransferase-like isoform X2 [Varroa jacobsoni]|nr:carnosine N-methyltransferase-like isoform X2 [Varroa destructor]XP_022656069.1 carnosine N-methyltransferase-like isoform X2 [Varroa destructor]XP_022708385.1 carnosine N-methyltransferase-like isoform X2 [Varroa jacobsoni]
MLVIDKMVPRHQRFLEDYRKHLEQVLVSLDHNAEFLKELTVDVEKMFENQEVREVDPRITHELAPSEADMDKVRSVLKQFCREWSEAGRIEREQSFEPLIRELEQLFPEGTRDEVRVLVPGAGLGRLPYELAVRGFACQGNEYSFFMLCGSCFVLNRCKQVNMFTIYPYVHQFTNNMRNADQVRSVTVPDVNPAEAGINPNFSMAAGNFVEVYSEQPDTWDAVVTCFFIDTAQNVIEYIETIHKCLRPGGYWLNLGPLMYHYADMLKEESIEPSFEDIKSISQEIGFEIIRDKTGLKSSYCTNGESMLRYEYSSIFMLCRKRKQSQNNYIISCTRKGPQYSHA